MSEGCFYGICEWGGGATDEVAELAIVVEEGALRCADVPAGQAGGEGFGQAGGEEDGAVVCFGQVVIGDGFA